MGYAHPEMLVEPRWVAKHGRDAGIRLVEVNVDTSAYDQGHIEGALGWDWKAQLCGAPEHNKILSKNAFERLMAESAVGNDTAVILYGDENNSFAAWALWQMKIYGHKHVHLMNGGRKKWNSEGHEFVVEKPAQAREASCDSV